jgi:hypothetical protein
VPGIQKLVLLAKTFGVTVDWLLSEEETPHEPQTEQKEAACEARAGEKGAPPASVPERSNWVESIPGVIGKLIRKYGWLYGVHTAIGSVVFVVFGVLVKAVNT